MAPAPARQYLTSLLFIAVLLAAGCGAPKEPTAAETQASAPAAPAFPTPDLSGRPLVWFAPLPPMPEIPGRRFTGSEDFHDLFLPDAPWNTAADRIDVFELYGGWIPYAPGTGQAYAEWEAQLKQLVEFVKQHGLALAMEHSPITRPADCGTDAESWGGLEVNLETARIIQRLGGTLQFIAMDAPYYYTSLVDYPGACRRPAEDVAREIDSYIQGMKEVFPEVVIGDTEPLQANLLTSVYMDWIRKFREVTGYNLPFFHMDIDYARPDWPERVKELEDFARGEGIDFGILYFGSWDDLTDEAWLSNAGERIKRYELAAGGQPDHVLFQSWHNHPDRTLPDTQPYTYTGFINRYFEDKSTLGFRTEGPGANVAFGKSARSSRSLPDWPADNAVDGDPSTHWGSGDFPPNWVEIDLGQPYTISEIRLRLDQGQLVGRTVHNVYVRGPGTGDQLVLLHTFDGETADLDQLVYSVPEALPGIQYVRAEITLSPSWVSFREVEVIVAE